ncbi:hypothetical protein F511_39890 [Dorcoceras hygrometricum]|uniref:Uncharacterized protein n=1 Tax=Dorcoceras hygrometricum TaxID=472368 RepID=A0A2Z7A0F5_9LAMI|nr:hypothetical protein F511_39890 [Dorcoceras hygrometricum]
MSDKDRPKDDDGNGEGVAGGGVCEDEDGEGRKIPKRGTLFRLRKGKKIKGERRKEKRRKQIVGCFLCLKEPRTLDSAGESPTSDPNSREFTFDMLRDLIEKNDFYSNECNTHLD